MKWIWPRRERKSHTKAPHDSVTKLILDNERTGGGSGGSAVAHVARGVKKRIMHNISFKFRVKENDAKNDIIESVIRLPAVVIVGTIFALRCAGEESPSNKKLGIH